MAQERRKYPRAQVTMQVRLRWPGPLRQTTEVTETLDVSRGGLLVYSADGPALGRSLWLTFPYDSFMTAPEPEILAHVLRVERRPAGGSFVAIRFDGSAPPSVAAKPPVERRFLPRTIIGVPIAVRAPSCPWPEETMTLDLTPDGLSFITPRVYIVGDILKVAMRPGVTPAGWGSQGEIAARVVRVSSTPVLPVVATEEIVLTPSSSTSTASPGSSCRPDASAPSNQSGSRLLPRVSSLAPILLSSNDQVVALRRIP